MKTKFTFKHFLNLSIAIALMAGLLFIPGSTASYARADTASFIVQGIDADQVAGVVERYGGTVTSRLGIINGVAATISEKTITQIQASPSISAITPNAEVNAAGYVPETNYPDVVGADVVWEEGVTGEDVTVAIVDTGLNQQQGIFKGIDGHPGRIVGWVDFVDGLPSNSDPNGHGSHIAGVVGNSAVGEDGEWNGIAPGVNLVGVRVLNEEGYGTYEQVIQGIQWVIDNKDEYNIRVMNLSLVSPAQSPYWADPLNQAVTRAWAEGIVVVVAAGNGGPEPMSIGVPGNNPYVITAGAFTDNYTPYDWSDDYIAPFSAAGPTLDGFVKPDVVAQVRMLSP